MVDWGDGDYARIARVIEPAARHLVAFAGVEAGQRMLDVACGTGNAALAAAERGAEAVGVDASPRLVEAAELRAREAGAGATFLTGDVGALPVADRAFDRTLSVFGVIFADDPARAVAEMLRATRPGGVVGLTTWFQSGPIHEAAEVLRGVFPAQEGPLPRWHEPDWVGGLLVGAGGRNPDADEGRIAFRGASPDEWLAEQVRFHPMWRWARSALDDDRWEPVRRESIAILTAANEEPDAFRVTGRYHLVRARAG